MGSTKAADTKVMHKVYIGSFTEQSQGWLIKDVLITLVSRHLRNTQGTLRCRLVNCMIARPHSVYRRSAMQSCLSMQTDHKS